MRELGKQWALLEESSLLRTRVASNKARVSATQ
jgi:hypothetical protein